MQDIFNLITIFVTTFIVFLLFLYILFRKKKTQLHYMFLLAIGLVTWWSVVIIVQAFYSQNSTIVLVMENLSYIGGAYVPVSLFFIGIIYARTKITFNWKSWLIFLVPTITMVIIWTNNLITPHLFYQVFDLDKTKVIYGPYFLVHTIYSYALIGIGLYSLIYFSIKNAGFFSKQAILIILGTAVPLVTNVLYTFNIIKLSTISTPLTFSVAIVCYAIAIFRFNFLAVAPIALNTVVDRISDSFVVLNEELVVINYNKTFMDIFKNILSVKRNDKLTEIITSNGDLLVDQEKFERIIGIVKKYKKSYSMEKKISIGTFNRYFTIEITPIYSNKNFFGTIILLKDITQSKRDLETIRENQTIIMEQERLASLGQLIGGIAHNLKTPIMSIAGGIDELTDLATEYDESIGDKSVTDDDHHEIAAEMLKWLEKIRPYCSYMSEVISAVKGQAVTFNTSTVSTFTLDELIKRIDILMKHELIRGHCEMINRIEAEPLTEIKGDVNSLVQVFDNIIVNAIYAYEGANGIIEFSAVDRNGVIEFAIRDHAKGMSEALKSKLFKEMITTKGKDGTGLGLYMSYSTIKGRFSGNMWLESELGVGTTIYISIPYVRVYARQEVENEEK